MPPASKQNLIKAYRDLYRLSLRVVQYSLPARFIVRDHLRAAFRNQNRTLEPARIARTREFLDTASRQAGLEHMIIKRLLFVWWTRGPDGHLPRLNVDGREAALRKNAYVAFDEYVRKLENSMGFCLQ